MDGPGKSGEKRTAISLFSGAGLSDIGYAAAGFQFIVQVEKDSHRAAIGQANFPASRWLVGDVRRKVQEIVSVYRKSRKEPLDLLVATPPCQGMSSSNPSRGKRETIDCVKNDEKNSLILALVAVAKALRPKLIVAENVRQVLTAEVNGLGVVQQLKSKLPEYEFVTAVVDVADYGVPQRRKRAVIVGFDRKRFCDIPICTAVPEPTHGPADSGREKRWVTLRNWLTALRYEKLDAKSKESATGKNPLHYVPSYTGDRYLQVSSIPKHTGHSAYENSMCPHCKKKNVDLAVMRCPKCEGWMTNRPYVKARNGRFRLIRGFHSSYRRMKSSSPAPTITTNSSHVGADFKIHPYEHRVLSALECADLQTVPRIFDWSVAIDAGKKYSIRNVVGEAFPPYFTMLHGNHLQALLALADKVAKTRPPTRRTEPGSTSYAARRSEIGHHSQTTRSVQ